MTATVFRQVGPYVIEKTIGQGGMASVFLARDTRSERTVALKVVHVGADPESREILEAEQRGANLQQRFSTVSRYVPAVYESGFATDHYYIAMEYIAGDDLSQAIHEGPLAPARAVAIAIQLCEFLEQADQFETRSGSESRRVLLHNDLKPRNIRLMAGDVVKVLDFGAAKSLSLSRKVTRNDFGSIAYLSPECLDSGERDIHTDAWALGVLLYEMVRGWQPFRAEDTRRLEQRIRARRPPDALESTCPVGLQAVIGKLLAPDPADRYDTPGDIRADLERVRDGDPTDAEAEGWPNREADEPPTRRTHPPMDTAEDPPTRPTPKRPGLGATAQPIPLPTIPPPAIPPLPSAIPTPPRARSRTWRFVRNAAIVVAVMAFGNEACVSMEASRVASTVPLQEFEGLSNVWSRYEALLGRSTLGGAGVQGLERALARQTLILAERVMANYRTPMPTVRENQWRAARDALRRALVVASNDSNLRAALRYCDGHLHRIDGEAAKSRRQMTQAQQEFTDAVTAFREAAALRSRWPDPFLGLARTFIYGLEDVDRGADALNQAQTYGHVLTDRETTQLGDGYRSRGETLARTAADLSGMPQEREYLTRSAEAFRQALTHYLKIPGFANVASNIRATQTRLERVEERLDAINRLDLINRFAGRGSWD